MSFLEFIKQDIDIPPGMFIWQDPPLHTIYRNVVSRVFTPRRMNDLEASIREYCARCLDPVAGAKQIDFIADLGAQLPPACRGEAVVLGPVILVGRAPLRVHEPLAFEAVERLAEDILAWIDATG